MTEKLLISSSIFIVFLSWLITKYMVYFARKNQIMDIPNERSSHNIPTPKGGGVSIVITFLLSLILLWSYDYISHQLMLGITGAGFIVAFIGFIDDHRDISPSIRLFAHLLAATWGVAWINPFPVFELHDSIIDFGKFGSILAVINIVWLLNLYNFMDGIDGIASIEALTVSIGVLVVSSFYIPNIGGDFYAVLFLLGAVSGFLFWNIPKAKIFMGDVGSGFLGLVFGLFIIHSLTIASELFWTWIIMLGVFIVDATVTIFRRMMRSRNIYQAHKSHAYQYLARKHHSHMIVTSGVAAINIFWLLPISISVARGSINVLVGLLIAYIPLIIISIKGKAGAVELQEI